MKTAMKFASLLALSLITNIALANPGIVSREYKLELQTNQFSYQTEADNVASLIQASKAAIELAIGRNVSGTPLLKNQRDIRFFDTPSTCELYHHGYSFRERVENGQSEVTLKFRSPDRYISDFEDVSSNASGADTKLEADIGANSTNDFKILYSHSTTVPNSRNLNNMEDINHYFPGFKSQYDLSDSLPLTAVGFLTIRERVYKDVIIDLGSIDAEISVTLWYLGVPLGAQTPVIAEISFKYADPSADYTRQVVNRAKVAFDALKALHSWVDPDSITKTAFIYTYSPTFCQ